MLLFIVPRSWIQKSYLVIMVAPDCPSADGLVLGRGGGLQRCRKHGIDHASSISASSPASLHSLECLVNLFTPAIRPAHRLSDGVRNV